MAWLSDWAKRIEITVDNTNIDSDLTHFPVPIVLGTAVGQEADDVSCIFDEVGANRKKIAVTKDDGTTQIYVEIEHWDEVAEKAVLWVSKSDLTITSASTTTLYLYYDDSKADNTTYVGDVTETPARNVWDADFEAVYHMSQDPDGDLSGAIKDSTSHARHATPGGSMTSADLVDGQLGKAIEFDGSDDYIDTPFQFSGNIGTLQAIARFNSSGAAGASHTLIDADEIDDVWIVRHGQDAIQTALNGGGSKITSSTVNTGQFYCVHATYDQTDHKLFIDGGLDSSANYSSALGTANDNIRLGRRNPDRDDRPMDGVLDEVRISFVSRSNAWIKADYYAVRDDLLTYGSEESLSSVYTQDYRVLNALAAGQGIRALNAFTAGATVRLKSFFAGTATTKLKNRLTGSSGSRLKNAISGVLVTRLRGGLAGSCDTRLRVLVPLGKDWRVRYGLAATRDVRLLGKLAWEISRDVRIRNRIAGLYQTDTRLKNEIEGTKRYIRDVHLRNLLLPDSAARHISNTWDAAIAGTSIKDHCRGLRITMNEASFTNEVDLDLNLGTAHGAAMSPAELLALVRGNKGTGQDTLVVTIDGTAYKFMIEETTREHTPPATSVWGRSLTAKLADPFYTAPVSKTWDSATLASTIVAELAPGFTIDWQIQDFVVPAGVLAAENDMPLDVIRELVERSQGALVRSGIAGELILRPRRPTAPKDVPAATPAATWLDGEDLLALSDDYEPAEGWNAVTVKGKTSITGAGIQVELDADRNNGKTTFLPGQEAFVRVYTSPIGTAYEHQVTLGTATKLGIYSHVVEGEEIQVQDGRAGTRYPIYSVQTLDFDGRVLSSPEWEQGGKEIRFNVAEGCSGSAYLKLDYTARYDLWKVKADQAGKAILCLEET